RDQRSARWRRPCEPGWNMTFPPLHREPVEAVRPERDEVRQLSHGWERLLAEDLDRKHDAELTQIKLSRLCEPGQVGSDEHDLVLVAAQEGDHLSIVWIEELDAAAAKRLVALAEGDHTFHPLQQRVRILSLRHHV